MRISAPPVVVAKEDEETAVKAVVAGVIAVVAGVAIFG